MKQTWPAPERNKGPILEVLARVLPTRGDVLEIASGTGQHAVWFAAHLPALCFQPTDVDEENLASIAAWVREAALPNLRAPLKLDVRDESWPKGPWDAIFNANMIHIAPWDCAQAFLSGAGRHLRHGGVLVLYGPFSRGGEHTAQSNADFDAELRRRNPAWGVRDVEAVCALAERAGLSLREQVAMPANNQCLVFSH